MPGDPAATIFKDFGFLGLGLATFFYLARALYALTRANGQRQSTLNDVVKAIDAHAKEEKDHHDRQEERENELNRILTSMRTDVLLLLDRGKRLP